MLLRGEKYINAQKIRNARKKSKFLRSPAVMAIMYDQVEVLKYIVQRLGAEPVIGNGVRHQSMVNLLHARLNLAGDRRL